MVGGGGQDTGLRGLPSGLGCMLQSGRKAGPGGAKHATEWAASFQFKLTKLPVVHPVKESGSLLPLIKFKNQD